MTAVIACFLHNGTYDELAKKCQRPKKTPVVEEPPADVVDKEPDLNSNDISNETADANSDFGTEFSDGTTSCNDASLSPPDDSANSGSKSGDGAIDAASSNGDNGLSGTGTSCSEETQ